MSRPDQCDIVHTDTVVGANLQDFVAMNKVLNRIVQPHLPTLVLCELALVHMCLFVRNLNNHR
jgi:hypothetical protein